MNQEDIVRFRERRAWIVDRYRSGESMTKIAKSLGITTQRVSQILMKEGVIVPKWKRKSPE